MTMRTINRSRAAVVTAVLALTPWAHGQALQWYRPAPPPLPAPPQTAVAIPSPPAPPAPSGAEPSARVSMATPTVAMDGAARRYAPLIEHAATRHVLDPLLLHAVVATESAYGPARVSTKGAIGLMQVLPATGRRFGVSALQDPQANLEAGAAYLQWLIQRFDGRLDLALAGYNAGEGAVARHGNSVPPYAETRAYVRKVMARYADLKGEVLPAALPPAAMPAAAFSPPPRPGIDLLLRLLIGGDTQRPPSGGKPAAKRSGTPI